MSLGQRIRHHRERRKWTLEALAERSGVDVGTISALENRNSQRSKFTAAIAKAFGLSIEQLLDDSCADPASSRVSFSVAELKERLNGLVCGI